MKNLPFDIKKFQASIILKVDEECLSNGRFPNGEKLTLKDAEVLEFEIENCKNILENNGLINNQLKLF